jgi:hypothetical protein
MIKVSLSTEAKSHGVPYVPTTTSLTDGSAFASRSPGLKPWHKSYSTKKHSDGIPKWPANAIRQAYLLAFGLRVILGLLARFSELNCAHTDLPDH